MPGQRCQAGQAAPRMGMASAARQAALPNDGEVLATRKRGWREGVAF